MLLLNYQDASVIASTRNVARRSANSPVQHCLPAGPAKLERGLHGSRNRTRGVKSRKVQSIVAQAAKAPGTALLAVPFSLGTGDVFVAGATGQIGARIVQELLQSGQKVVAGVGSEADGAALLDFAKRFELLTGAEAGRVRLTEVDFSKEDSIAAAIPRKGKVVVVVGDTGAVQGGKAEAGLPSRLIAAAKEGGASQILLVAPYASPGGGGFFGGGARPRAPGTLPPPSKLEEEVAGSGIPFAILRTGKYDENLISDDGGLELSPQGSLPQGAKVSKNQVAEAAAKLLLLAKEDVLVEAWTDPSRSPEAAEVLLEEVLPKAVIGAEAGAEVEEEEEAEEPKAVQLPGLGAKVGAPPLPIPQIPKGPLFGFGPKKAAKEAEGEEEEEVEEKLPKKPSPLFLGFGLPKPKAVEEEEEEEEEEKPAKKPLFGFGAAPVKAEKEEPEKKSGGGGGLFGFGAKKEAEEKKEEAKPAKGPSLFGFGAKPAKAEGADEAPAKPGLFGATKKIQKEDAAPKRPASISKLPPQMLTIRGRASSPGGSSPRPPRRGPAPQPKKAAPPPAPKTAAGKKEDAPAPKKGFLQSLGIGQDTAYVDELDK